MPADSQSPPTPADHPHNMKPIEPWLCRAIIDNLSDGVSFVDLEDRIRLWNKSAERITGLPPCNVLNLHSTAILAGPHSNSRAYESLLATVLQTGKDASDRLSLRHKDGRTIVVDAHAAPVRDPSGSIIGAVVTFRDAASSLALERACGRLRSISETDPLTGLANRRHVDIALNEQLQILNHAHFPFSIILADLDHFKRINDTWGHTLGDQVLQAFAQRLRAQCRPTDVVARYGGEEFLVILPGTQLEQAIEVAQRICTITPLAAPPALKGTRITASFGVAEARPSDTLALLLNRADAALYKAKHHGRERVVAHLPNRAPHQWSRVHSQHASPLPSPPKPESNP